MSPSPKVNDLIFECVEDSNYWNNQFLNVSVRSLELYEDRRQFNRLVRQFLSKNSQFEFNAANPYVQTEFGYLLYFKRSLLPWKPGIPPA
jgi:hypothetical protein